MGMAMGMRTITRTRTRWHTNKMTMQGGFPNLIGAQSKVDHPKWGARFILSRNEEEKKKKKKNKKEKEIVAGHR